MNETLLIEMRRCECMECGVSFFVLQAFLIDEDGEQVPAAESIAATVEYAADLISDMRNAAEGVGLEVLGLRLFPDVEYVATCSPCDGEPAN